jgi:dihydrofolate synthase / folylpolyglutamate synthase
MTYNETIEYLYTQLPVFHRIGKAAYKADLSNTIALDNYLGNPHKKFLSVHIAGTNGKGSVSHMLASIFQEAGYKTALYTSPHLKDYRERIRIDGKMISEEEVVLFVEDNNKILNTLKPSFFEMSVAMAFDHFARNNVDIAIVETGLGGRLDSTNIITPILSVITNIGHDHMDLLGDSLEKISAEKAGIIKKNIPVIVGEKQKFSDSVFIGKASETFSELFFAEDFYECSLDDFDPVSGYRGFSLTQTDKPITIRGQTPLGGDCQSKNIQVAACVADLLRCQFSISNENILNGIKNTVSRTGLLGRWQVIGIDPLIVCDTGHNKEGLQYVMSQILRIPKIRLHMVIGFVKDKDLSSVLPLFPADAIYYFTKASVPRALDEKILMNESASFGLQGESFVNVAHALNKAKENAGKHDMIFIGGSTFIVADLLQIIKEPE